MTEQDILQVRVYDCICSTCYSIICPVQLFTRMTLKQCQKSHISHSEEEVYKDPCTSSLMPRMSFLKTQTDTLI